MNEQNDAQSKPQIVPVEFTGSGREFFRIWIVNLVLTILTIGIYSAWAKVRTNRYFYGNTRLGGSSFEYLAKPIMILKGRLIAIGLLLIYIIVGEMFPVIKVVFVVALIALTPWIVWRSLRFNARMSSYRNVRFGFYGKLIQAYRYLLFIPFIPFLIASVMGAVLWLLIGPTAPKYFGHLFFAAFFVTYVLTPYLHKSIAAYTINNYRYGQGKFSADLSTGQYYKIYLAMLGFALAMLLAFSLLSSLVVAISGIGPEVFQTRYGDMDPQSVMSVFIGVSLVMYVVMILAGAFLKAYLQVRVRNYLFSKTRLDDALKLQSQMTVWRLYKFYLVNILMMIFTLGLAYPWVKVRIAHFSAQATKVEINGSLDLYVTQQLKSQSALGEEMGEAFDVDAAVDLAF